jgi:ArsR family transcriptional regulator
VSDEEALAGVFAALANTSRLALVRELAAHSAEWSSADQGATITQLATRTELSRFSASRHLGVLRDCGLVQGDRVGRRMLHRLNSKALDDLDDWLYPLLARSAPLSDTADGF